MERLSMRKIKDVMRLGSQGLSARKIAASLGISRGAVAAYADRAQAAGLTWPLPVELTEGALESLLFPASVQVLSATFPQPDWAQVHIELRRKGVTLALLWEEYRGVNHEGYGYSRYCELYRRWEGHLSPVMRQHHVAGERLFVDYAGATLDVVCAETGEIRSAQVFPFNLFGPRWVHPVTPMSRRPGRKACQTGLPRMSAPSRSSAAPRRRWSRTI